MTAPVTHWQRCISWLNIQYVVLSWLGVFSSYWSQGFEPRSLYDYFAFSHSKSASRSFFFFFRDVSITLFHMAKAMWWSSADWSNQIHLSHKPSYEAVPTNIPIYVIFLNTTYRVLAFTASLTGEWRQLCHRADSVKADENKGQAKRLVDDEDNKGFP